MVDEVVDTESKPKKPMLKIIVAVVALIIVLVGVVVATLFVSKFFSQAPDSGVEQAAGPEGRGGEKATDDGHGGKKADDGHGGKKDGKPSGPPEKRTKQSPELTRFDYTYFQLEREFLVNITGSRKVMSVQLAVMTRYDQRVTENVKKHEFALRSVLMDVMRQVTDVDLGKPEFRKELAQRLRDAMNTLLEKYEDFGGIEEVYFTSFIVQ